MRLNNNLEPAAFHLSISDLFLLGKSPQLLYLRWFENLLEPIVLISCSARCPVGERTSHFLTKISMYSTHSSIKKH